MNPRAAFRTPGFRLLAVLVLPMLLVAACGGGSKPAATPAAAATELPRAAGPVFPCKGLPPAVAFVMATPGPGIPPNLAAFSGAWEGMAGADYAGLIIESMTAKETTGYYFFSNLRGRIVSQFQQDGSLHQGGQQQITFTWTQGRDVNELKSVRQEGNDSVTYTMRKCTLE